MPDFQVIRRKGKKPATEAPQELTQEDESSLLSHAGAGAMSGLHTLGSILSWPSRLVHGAINAAVGGKEGFGENYLNPFDSRGGVEGSRHLINAGILAENNPHEWEWGDLGRGLADLALDPTTYIGPGLTKAGMRAAKLEKGTEGALAAGRIAQTAAGQRALLNVGLPFMEPAISIGTGKGTAEALKTIGRRTGLTAATNAVKKSYPVRAFGGLFNSDYLGKTLPTLQEEAAKASEARRGLNAETELDVIRASRDDALNAYSQQDLRRALEGAEPSVAKEGYVPHPMTNDPNLVPHEMIHINPQGKILENFPDAAHNGMVDELVSSGKAIPAPMMHLDAAGKPVFGKGQLDPTVVKKLAKEAYKQELRPFVEKVLSTPQWADKPFSVTDVLHSQFPESLNTATVAFRDIAKATGKTPAEIVEALNKEIPGGFSLQRHDFPDQIIHEGRQGEHFWSPKDPGDIGSHDKAFVGFSLRPETGKAIDAAQQAAKQAAPTIPPLHPERIAAKAELKKFQKGRKTRLQEHAARIAKELQGQHGGDEALALLAKMRDLKEPGMAVMVPRDQAEKIRRMYAGGERTRNLSDTTKAIQSLPEFEHLRAGNDLTLTRQRERGFGLGEELHDKTVKHWPRRESVTKALDDAGKVIQRGSASLPVKTADDVSRKWFMTGHFDGSEGINGILKDPALHAIVKEQGVEAATELGRQRHGHMFNGLYQDAKQRSLVAKTQKAATRYEAAAIANEQKIADMANNTAINAARQSTDPEMLKAVAKHDGEIKRLQNKANEYRQKHAQALAAHEEALHAGHDRMPALIKYIKKHPELEGVDKFGNHPLSDYKVARLSTDRKYALSEAVTQSLKRELNKGDRAISLGDYLKNKGFKLRTVAERIAGRKFEDAADMKAFLSENKVDSKLAKQLNDLMPAYKAPEAVNELTEKFKSAMAWWKGATLAFPSSRFRDASGGAVWNLLHGWGNKKFYADAKKLLTGETITTNYGHVPEIQKWLKKSKKEWSPENQTEAIRQLTSVFIPSDHNILADVPTGQIGAGLEQLTHNVPGKQKTTLYNQFIGDPLRALAGKDPGGASWFGRGEPGESTLGRLAKAAKHITEIRGVGDATETMLAPVKASEIVAANSDAYNRTVPFLQQLHGGTAAPVAGRNVNKVQIDYNPESFTATERAIKNYLMPFYCVPTDHEILTRDGWKFYNSLTVGEEVMAYDLATGGLHWTPLQAVNVFDFDGELNVFRQNKVGNGKTNFRTIEFLFTDDHRWPTIVQPRMISSAKAARESGGTVTKIKYKGLRKFVRGADLQTQHTIPNRGTYSPDNPTESILSVRLAKILGWVVTDGYHRWRRRKPEHAGSLEMMVYQSPSKHLESIVELLGTNPRNPHPDTGVVCVPVSHADVSELKKVFTSKEDMPRIVSRLSPEAAEAMWQVMMDAEGSDNGKNSPHFAQCGPNSAPVIDAFQILCLMTGRSANVSSMGCYVKKSKAYHIHNCLEKRQYTGEIWCPTTAYGTWIMRHNGAMIITGNSFNSRILSPTAKQLSNFGSPTSQLVKTINRAHGGGDASVPDYVMSGSGVPLGKRADGSKTYLTGLGQMYEPAVSNIGLAAAMLHDPRAAQALAYDSAAMLNPLINVPLQRMTGQSFFQRGAPIRDMDPIVGRLLSNIGESTGLMEPGSRPVDVPGSQYIDTFLGGTPFGRAAGQIRTLADPRKDIRSKLVDTLSGAKVTDISPEKQMATLQKRAEDLARSQGAWEQRTVGFPKEQLARLAQTNPQLAAEQQHLQNMITAMKRKRTIRRKQKAAEKK